MSNNSQVKKVDAKIFVFIGIYVFIVTLFLSSDSYFYDIWGRHDGAWFFMGGKALMNGMIPYVDFTDSKGPLLWLIYGIGYKISATTYLGVFWVSVIFYITTFTFYYKTIALFIKNKKWSLLGTCLMALPFFFKIYHYETRAEDFCSTFIAIGMYYSLSCYSVSFKDQRLVNKTSFLLGVALGACLLIKYSIAVMIGSMCSLVFIESYFRGNALKSFVMMVCGAFAVCAPFMIYLLSVQAVMPFLKEYFFNTARTVSDSSAVSSILADWTRLLLSKKRWPCILYWGASLLFSIRNKQYHGFPVLVTGAFVLLSSINAYWYYYLSINASFAIFLIILLTNRVVHVKLSSLSAMLLSVIILVMTIIVNFIPTYFFTNVKGVNAFHTASSLFSKVPNPTILNLGSEVGIGLQAEPLPACKDWCWQAGATPQMIDGQLSAIKERKPDFVTISRSHTNFESCVLSNGYRYCCDFPHHDDTYKLFCKAEYDIQPDEISVSWKDILFKKKLY